MTALVEIASFEFEPEVPPTGVCVDCGSGTVNFGPCPYAEDIYNDTTPMWLCDDCGNQRAQDI